MKRKTYKSNLLVFKNEKLNQNIFNYLIYNRNVKQPVFEELLLQFVYHLNIASQLNYLNAFNSMKLPILE